MSSNVTLSSGQLSPAVRGDVAVKEGPDGCGAGGCGAGAAATVVAELVVDAELPGVVGAPLVSSVSVNWPSAPPIIATVTARTMQQVIDHRCKAG